MEGDWDKNNKQEISYLFRFPALRHAKVEVEELRVAEVELCGLERLASSVFFRLHLFIPYYNKH